MSMVRCMSLIEVGIVLYNACVSSRKYKIKYHAAMIIVAPYNLLSSPVSYKHSIASNVYTSSAS